MKKFAMVLFLGVVWSIFASTGWSTPKPAPSVLIVVEDVPPPITRPLKMQGYQVTVKAQDKINKPITGYTAVFVYVEPQLKPKVVTRLIDYAEKGGRLIVFHDGINYAKKANKRWLDFLGVRIYPKDHKKYPWAVTKPRFTWVVNLMPEHYITSHDVPYDEKMAYTSRDRGDLKGTFPAFELMRSPVSHNIRSTDGNEKVILLGSQINREDNEADTERPPTMEETAGWYKQVKRGWVFYFQQGGTYSDFCSPSFSQVLLNCLEWKPNDPKYAAAPTMKPLFTTVDLNVGESVDVKLTDGRKVSVKLVDLKQKFDTVRHAVRDSDVSVEIDGKPLVLHVGNYNLPVKFAGLQVDCPVAGKYVHKIKKEFNPWDLHKAVRLRLWPGKGPWVRPETYGSHANGEILFTSTQMGSEPAYVNWCDLPPKNVPRIYYHYGLDIGGNEGQFEIVAAADGVVVSACGKDLPGYQKNLPNKKRADVVYVLDRRGWFYRYSHFCKIYDSVKLGHRVKKGQPLGLLGKEGASGGWAHSHFDISSIQPTGKYGIEDAYPFMWQGYIAASGTQLKAVARPHHLLRKGEEVTLDATRSWSALGKDGIVSYEWTFCDGTTAKGLKVTRRYDTPGSWSETLKVTDREGRVDYDFCTVLVVDPERKESPYPPTIHATYYPTTGLKAGDPVTFHVRSFGIDEKDGHEEWDFGDGSPTVKVRSDGNKEVHAKDGYAVTTHRYAKPGSYLVSVCRTNKHGQTAIGRLNVVVE